jgi:hypothetical protein
MKRAVKIIGFVLGSLALIAALGIVALIISWNVRKDETLLPEVAQIIAPRPEPPKEQNGFYIHMGINAAAGKDAAKVGMAIVEAANKFTPSQDVAIFTTPKEIEGEPRLTWMPSISNQLCRFDQTPCLHIYRESPVAINAKAVNEEILSRYLAMQRVPHYQSDLSAHPTAPQPPWQVTLRASEVIDAVSVRSLANVETGDRAFDALAALAADFRYWRWHLANGDELIQRMVANAVLERKLTLLSEVLSAQPTIAASPRFMEMTTPLKSEERSMLRPLMGDVRYVQATFARMAKEKCQAPSTIAQRFNCAIGFNAFKLNATTNMHYARLMRSYTQIGASPRAAMDAKNVETATQAEYEGKIPAIPGQLFYNPIGDILVNVSVTNYSSYYARNADLEVRFKLVEAKRRIIASGAVDIPAAIAALPPELLNPYTDKPFEWDAKTGEMWFTPAAPRSKAVTRISVKF